MNAAALLLLALCLSPAWGQGEVTIRNTEWTVNAVGGQPPSDADWGAKELPVQWRSSENAPLAGLTLRMHFTLAERPGDAYAALIPVATDGGRVSVNGHFIGAIASPDAHTEIHFERPHLLAIDPALLNAGENTLLLQTAYRGGQHVYGEVKVGPLGAMSRLYEREYFLRSTITWIGLTLAAVIALIFGVLWLRRRDPYMGLITGAAIFWSLRSATYVNEIMPLWLRFWVRLMYFGSIGGFAAVMTILLLRMSDLRNRREELMIIGYAALGAILFVVTGQRAAYYLDTFWIPGLIAMPAFAVVVALNSRVRHRNSPHWFVMAASALAFIAWTHDYASGRGWILPDATLAMHWAAPLLLAALATPLVDRFVGILREAEAAREDLESRVREREQLLKR